MKEDRSVPLAVPIAVGPNHSTVVAAAVSAGAAVENPKAQAEADAEHSQCLMCSKAFSLFARKHHCRVCQKAYCSSCSRVRLSSKTFSKVVQVSTDEDQGSLRACEACSLIAETYGPSFFRQKTRHRATSDSPAPEPRIAFAASDELVELVKCQLRKWLPDAFPPHFVVPLNSISISAAQMKDVVQDVEDGFGPEVGLSLLYKFVMMDLPQKTIAEAFCTNRTRVYGGAIKFAMGCASLTLQKFKPSYLTTYDPEESKSICMDAPVRLVPEYVINLLKLINPVMIAFPAFQLSINGRKLQLAYSEEHNVGTTLEHWTLPRKGPDSAYPLTQPLRIVLPRPLSEKEGVKYFQCVMVQRLQLQNGILQGYERYKACKTLHANKNKVRGWIRVGENVTVTSLPAGVYRLYMHVISGGASMPFTFSAVVSIAAAAAAT